MRKVLVLVALFYSFSLLAQRQDFATWWTFELEGEIFKKIDYSISPELRLYNNSTTLKSTILDFNVSYPVIKNIRLGGQYRIQEKFYYDEIEYMSSRFGLYARFNHRIKRLRLKYRALYQWEYLGVNAKENSYLPLQEHRHKITASYYRKKWDMRPIIAAEFFFLHKPEYLLKESKYRISAGASYDIVKRLKIGVFYRYQQEIIANNPWNIHMITTKINFSL